MGKYSYGRGRKRAVQRFTKWQGLAILLAASGTLVGLIVLWMLGYLRFDVH
jgi:hypothetical protein